MENKITSRQVFGFHLKEFSETPYPSLQLYCLEKTSVWFASAINERQLLFFTYIHARGTELCCYIFLFISIGLRACCVIHFYSCTFSMHV